MAERETYSEFLHMESTEEIVIPPRKEYTQIIMVPANKKVSGEMATYYMATSTNPLAQISYTFVIKDLDISFGVRLRSMGEDGAVEEDILDFQKFESKSSHEGSIMAGDFDKLFVLCFDNKSSFMASKTILFNVELKDDDLRAASPNLNFLDAQEVEGGGEGEGKGE